MRNIEKRKIKIGGKVEDNTLLELLNDARADERQCCAARFSARLAKLSTRILQHKLDYANASLLLTDEVREIERQAGEWHYV
ncbi:DUF2732 family protein [Photorhabdus laumondii subsp. laumondii]|uniref:DUF2732 family protein n=2 Tax=Photorhabdus TaxID=29487 RepID=A0AAW6BHR1_9GAMM|nr:MULTISPECIES: DUF2732 family protein [Photorhabdus]AXG42651.1 hypothetical protein PluDJC_10610 [Photorhabdus laumondii subsp. laumondii]MCC8384758.1 DUF2732 family protein [Photorhabdus laumondii]MCC8413495.1 DUF2732 family protein [Photorhabdus laumondii]MDB6372296.1 DUF2732 family protein [Photorhabdus bodei]NDK96459.1 DUF2732 family protein [Photorhabdus laumondii subsp. laumondii]